MSTESLPVVFTARLVASRRVFSVSDESNQEMAQALLDLVEHFGDAAEQHLAAMWLKRNTPEAPKTWPIASGR